MAAFFASDRTGDVRLWHLADILAASTFVRFGVIADIGSNWAG